MFVSFLLDISEFQLSDLSPKYYPYMDMNTMLGLWAEHGGCWQSKHMLIVHGGSILGDVMICKIEKEIAQQKKNCLPLLPWATFPFEVLLRWCDVCSCLHLWIHRLTGLIRSAEAVREWKGNWRLGLFRAICRSVYVCVVCWGRKYSCLLLQAFGGGPHS